MKKKIFLLIILCLCILLTGCENNNGYDKEEINRIGNIVNGS